ncbi:hypothetical protein ABTC12_19825, partial [Acinetobacter baumannii]
LTGALIVDLEWKIGADGKAAGFTEIPGSEREIACELVLLAMGFLYPQQTGLIQQLEVRLDERGNVKAAENSYQTSLSKVFTAGDM